MGEDGHGGCDRRMDSPEKEDLLVTHMKIDRHVWE